MSIPTPSKPALPPKTAKLIAEVKKCREAVPPIVSTAYEPSGKFEALSIPMLILGSIAGWLIGGLIAAAGVGLVAGIIMLAGKAGSCNAFLFLGAVAFYFLFPIAIPIAQGIYIGKSAKWGRCRSIPVVMTMSIILGLLTAGVFFIIGPVLTLLGTRFDYSMDTCGFLHPTMLAEPVKLYVYGGIMAVLSLLIAVGVSTSAVKEHKFCEKCLEYMKDKVLMRFPTGQAKALVLTLLERSWDYKDYLDKNQTRPGEDLTDVTHWTCRCQKTNYLECTAHWTTVKQTDKGEDKTKHDQLIYSARLTPDEVKTAVDLLTKPKPAAPPPQPGASLAGS